MEQTSLQSSPSSLASRYQSLLEAQTATAAALSAFRQEVDIISGLQDPLIWTKVQEELSRNREPSFARGHFAGWTAHENLSLHEDFGLTSAQFCHSPLSDSPLFGAVDGLGSTNSFGAVLEPLDAIPPLPSLSTSSFTLDSSFLDAPSSYARSNSTSSSIPSPSRSPYLSPFAAFPDLSFAAGGSESFNSPYSTSPYISCGTETPLLPVGAAEDLSAYPLFASPGSPDIIAQLQAVLDASAPASVPLARGTSKTGKARRGSSCREGPRFNPMGHSRTTSVSGADALSRSLPIAISSSTSSQGIASIAVQMSALSTSPTLTSPPLRPTDTPLSRSGSTKKRATRAIVSPELVAVTKNSQHLFAVHTQAKSKVDISENSVTPLILCDDTDPTTPLARCVYGQVKYSSSLFREDCSRRNTYTFLSDEGSNSWTVSFSQFGVRIQPSTPSSAIFTFIHFAPGDIVVQPSYPLGSRLWWRQQECQQSHAGFPGEGHWTCRYDGDAQEKRRPIRIIQHFSSCPSARVDEYGGQASWSLGKLAKAILEVLPTV